MRTLLYSLALATTLTGTIQPSYASRYEDGSGATCSGCKVILQRSDAKVEAAEFMINPSDVSENFEAMFKEQRDIVARELGIEAAESMTIEDFAAYILAQ